MEMKAVDCSGVDLPVGGGTWIGHVIPGLFFMLWGVHWMQAMFRKHIHSQSTGQLFSSRAWFSLAGICRWFHAAEPFLKMLAGPIGLSLELYFDDKNGLRPLYCKDGLSAGQFAIKYAHNYHHAAMYPAFVVSGLVDFVGMRFRLPPDTERVFLGAAFLNEGFLMMIHTKHLPLDKILHLILGVCMLSTALGIFAEMRAPHNFMISTFRSFSLTMHGLWMILMGQMLFTGSKAWNDDYAGAAMLAPPFFCLVALTVALCFLIVYLVLDLLYQWRQKYTTLPQTVKPMGTNLSRHSPMATFSMDESTIDFLDDGLETADSVGSDQGSVIRKQLITMTSKLKKFPLPNKHSKAGEHVR